MAGVPIAAQRASLRRAFECRVQPWLRRHLSFTVCASPSRCTWKRLNSSSALLVARIEQTPFNVNIGIKHHLPCLSSVVAFASQEFSGSVAGYSTKTVESSLSGKLEDPVVSAEWLHSHLCDPNIKVLDASWYMPADKRNPLEEFKTSHIPGALFFDVDGVVDPTSDLPHMLPSETAFAAAMSSLGIRNTDTIVVYDGKGIFSAARVWWMFRVFGHDNVVVLDGGLPKWRTHGFSLESSVSPEFVNRIEGASKAVKSVYQGEKVEAIFKASLRPELVWSADQVKHNISEKNRLLIDARSKARFDGVAPEPRKGIRGGHIPGSKCVPFTDVLKDGSTLLEADELKRKFEAADVPLESPIVASCGTGVTACVLALALNRLGKDDVPVYDGSWTEWGGLPDTPVETNTGS